MANASVKKKNKQICKAQTGFKNATMKHDFP